MSSQYAVEIQRNTGQIPYKYLEIDYQLKNPPSKQDYTNKYFQKYKLKLGIQLSKAQQKKEKNCLISLKDLENLIKVTKSIENTHRRAIQTNEEYQLKYCSPEQLLTKNLSRPDDKSNFTYSQNPLQSQRESQNFMLNNAIFNTLLENLEVRTMTKHTILDNKGNEKNNQPLAKLPLLNEVIQQNEDKSRLISGKAFNNTGRMYYQGQNIPTSYQDNNNYNNNQIQNMPKNSLNDLQTQRTMENQWRNQQNQKNSLQLQQMSKTLNLTQRTYRSRTQSEKYNDNITIQAAKTLYLIKNEEPKQQQQQASYQSQNHTQSQNSNRVILSAKDKRSESLFQELTSRFSSTISGQTWKIRQPKPTINQFAKNSKNIYLGKNQQEEQNENEQSVQQLNQFFK